MNSRSFFSTSVGVDLFDGVDFKFASGHISSVKLLLSSDVEKILLSEQLSYFCCEIRACVARLRTEGFKNSCWDVIDFGAQWVSDARVKLYSICHNHLCLCRSHIT